MPTSLTLSPEPFCVFANASATTFDFSAEQFATTPITAPDPHAQNRQKAVDTSPNCSLPHYLSSSIPHLDPRALAHFDAVARTRTSLELSENAIVVITLV